MKTIMITISAIILACFAFSQTPLKLVKERVGNTDILKNWDVGETKKSNDALILRVEGENDYDYITNVFYTPKDKILNLVNEKAKVEAMLPVEKDKLIEHYETEVPGGQIALFFCRPTKGLAEPANFSVRVLDENGTQLWAGMLDKQQPHYYRWEIWYYYKTMNIPVEVDESFIIKVDDAGTRKSFTFRVTQQDSSEPFQHDLSVKENLF